MKPNSKKILVIEDEEQMLNILVNKFTKEKFSVFTAKDGVDGLETALSNRPDVILLDIVMPRMDGITMLKKLRQDSWGKEAPVIILTNLIDPAKEIEAIEQEAKDYLVKTDWKLEDVVAKVKAVTKIMVS